MYIQTHKLTHSMDPLPDLHVLLFVFDCRQPSRQIRDHRLQLPLLCEGKKTRGKVQKVGVVIVSEVGDKGERVCKENLHKVLAQTASVVTSIP